jgi:hypothetical protein
VQAVALRMAQAAPEMAAESWSMPVRQMTAAQMAQWTLCTKRAARLQADERVTQQVVEGAVLLAMLPAVSFQPA